MVARERYWRLVNGNLREDDGGAWVDAAIFTQREWDDGRYGPVPTREESLDIRAAVLVDALGDVERLRRSLERRLAAVRRAQEKGR